MVLKPTKPLNAAGMRTLPPVSVPSAATHIPSATLTPAGRTDQPLADLYDHAFALLGLGWWLRRRNPNYGLMLQGTGIAVLYLTVFAAMRLHPLLDPKLALGLLVLVTAFSAILAVAQNALGLAVAAALGGFAAPILTSTGSGNHVALFSYFILLNAGILAIAWFKAWRLLNLVGFLGTFGIGFAWGLRSYTPELLWSSEPFLIVFFLMYVAIGLLFARRRLREAADVPEGRDELLRWSRGRADYVDATVLFGPPLVGFGLQYAIVQHIEFAAAFSALGLGLFYLVLARLLRGRNVLAPDATRSTGRFLFEGALHGGAQALGVAAGLQLGASADLVELDATHPALQARQDDAWLDSWVFATRNGALRSVWRHGRQCVADGRHLQREAITTAFAAALRDVLG